MIYDTLNIKSYEDDEFFNFYNDYEAHHPFEEEEFKRKAEVCSELIKDKKFNSMVDIATGYSIWLKHFKEINGIRRAVGTDISLPALKIAQKYNPDIDFYRADGENLPFKYKEFELVTMVDIVEHVKNPEVLLLEAKRIAKFALIKIPLEDCLLINLYKKIVKVKWEDIQGHINFWNLSSFNKMMEKNEFKLVKYFLPKAKMVPQSNVKLWLMNVLQCVAEIFPETLRSRLVPMEVYALYEC